MLLALTACDDDEPQSRIDTQQLVSALVTIDDVSFVPLDWEENTRAVVEAPVAPFDGTLDPYLCSEAGVPSALLLPQAQLELTGGGLMEILLVSDDATALYDELAAAYSSCGETSSLAYAPLAGVPAVGDESDSFSSELGFVTIARFGDTLMIVKWMVGENTEEAMEYYPQLVTTAVGKIAEL
jgi:hypothetical protein